MMFDAYGFLLKCKLEYSQKSPEERAALEAAAEVARAQERAAKEAKERQQEYEKPRFIIGYNDSEEDE